MSKTCFYAVAVLAFKM